jgi:hypothetical protein
LTSKFNQFFKVITKQYDIQGVGSYDVSGLYIKRFISRYGCSGMQKVKDSWRVVNHRDIIPTVPRLMGYCHVAQPIYLSAGGRNDNIVCSLYLT